MKTMVTPLELNKQRETAEHQWLRVRAEADFDTACDLMESHPESYVPFHVEKTSDLSLLLFKKI